MALLVLGGSGAIGSAVARHAASEGLEVHVALRQSSLTGRLDAASVALPLHRLALDDAGALGALMARTGTRAVVAAAFPAGYPRDTAARRCHGVQVLDQLLALFEACARQPEPPRLVLLGSATAHGHQGAISDDSGRLAPRSFRGALKAAQSILASQLAREAGVPLDELRLFTGYGPFEQRERLLPQLLRAALGGPKPRLVREERWRDWVHFDDVARACILAVDADLGTRNASAAVFDLCSGERHTLHHAATLLEAITGQRLVGGLRDDLADDYGDPGPGRPPDPERFPWRPRLSLAQGLGAYWRWARSTVGRSWLAAETATA